MSNGRPNPPTEPDSTESLISRRSTKSSKLQYSSNNRGIKRTNSSLSHEGGRVVKNGRHERVWKACERCRMKKTKCDGECPCKRCKNDGLVCTAGSRKKTEWKQLPKGYAEILENIQCTLIATVQKLYTMVRNGESWDLGDPEVNDRGMPVIHNIAEKLGCVRHSPDLPYILPEDAEGFAELQAQMKMESGDNEPKTKLSEESFPSRSDRSSCNESVHSDLSKDYNQMLWRRQQQQSVAQRQSCLSQSQLLGQHFGAYFEVQTNSETDLTVIGTGSSSSPWSAGGSDFHSQAHMLDLAAIYMRQQQQSFGRIPRFTPYSPALGLPYSEAMTNSTINLASCTKPYMAGFDGTIRPPMLVCSTGYDLVDQMDSIMFGQNMDSEAPGYVDWHVMR